MGASQTCGERCCGGDKDKQIEIPGFRGKDWPQEFPDVIPGLRLDAPMAADLSQSYGEVQVSGGGTGDAFCQFSPELAMQIMEDAANISAGGTGSCDFAEPCGVQALQEAKKLAERDGGLILGFRNPRSREDREVVFGTRKPPLGMDFTKTDPVTVKRVRKDTAADELGVGKGWQVISVNGVSMEGRQAADVFFRMKATLEAANALAETKLS